MNENDFKFNAIMSSCKYLLPCGRCEMTKKKCTADPKMTYTILKPNIYGVAYCSECDYELHTDNTNYCPNCGADMRGEQNG